MRLIGHLNSDTDARTFGDYLSGSDIKSLVEADGDGTWSVWIHNEDQVAQSSELLTRFKATPEDPQFKEIASKGAERRKQEKREQAEFEKRIHTRGSIWPNAKRGGVLTWILIGISVGVTLYTDFGDDRAHAPIFRISEHFTGFLPEVLRGQIWRLVTPIFLHFNILHLLFDMIWLMNLGSMIENRQGIVRLAWLVAIFAVGSNIGQYLIDGPGFGGMSGVVYGLFGYIWMKGKYDRASRLQLAPQTIVMMLVWFFLCFTGWLGDIANTAHAVGLVLGVLLGRLPDLGRIFRGKA